jgi:hypothetical protein
MLAENVGRVLTVADKLIAKGVHVVLVAHSIVKRTSPPDENDGYDRYELKLTKNTGPLVKEWADAILFFNFKTKLVEGADGRTKGVGGKERVMYAQRAAAYDAKNRFGLPESMPMTIDSLRPLFDGQAVAAKPLWSERVADATTVEQLGGIADEADAALSRGELTADKHNKLLAMIGRRHDELAPEEANATN